MHEFQTYQDVRERIQPGDIIAFGGNSLFSRWAKLTTSSVVTHLAIVIHNSPRHPDRATTVNEVMEATVYRGKRGVMKNRLSRRIDDYDGDVWWLPLREQARARFQSNIERFYRFMYAQEGKPYDVWQLFGSAVDAIDAIPVLGQLSFNEEDFSRWFCSELIAEGLERAGVIAGVNASEVTPVDICRFSIFAPRYAQLKGDERKIDGYNSLRADNWGQPVLPPHYSATD